MMQRVILGIAILTLLVSSLTLALVIYDQRISIEIILDGAFEAGISAALLSTLLVPAGWRAFNLVMGRIRLVEKPTFSFTLTKKRPQDSGLIFHGLVTVHNFEATANQPDSKWSLYGHITTKSGDKVPLRWKNQQPFDRGQKISPITETLQLPNDEIHWENEDYFVGARVIVKLEINLRPKTLVDKVLQRTDINRVEET